MARYYHVVERARADIGSLRSDGVMFLLLLKNLQKHFMTYWIVLDLLNSSSPLFSVCSPQL